jgi:hypothetical protein
MPGSTALDEGKGSAARLRFPKQTSEQEVNSRPKRYTRGEQAGKKPLLA